MGAGTLAESIFKFDKTLPRHAIGPPDGRIRLQKLPASRHHMLPENLRIVHSIQKYACRLLYNASGKQMVLLGHLLDDQSCNLVLVSMQL